MLAAAPGIIGAIGSLFGRKKRRREQAAARKEMEAAKQAYMNMKFENPYENIENPFEDLTVNQQAAQFQAQQVQQQQANLLEGFRGAAGSSGIAGLAQVLANQGALQTQKASASIAQQEQANQRAAASADLRIQQMQGTGDAMVQQAESSRQATILGMNQSVMAGVNANYQQQLLNQQKANAYANQTMVNSLSSLATLDLENIFAKDTTVLQDLSGTTSEEVNLEKEKTGPTV